MEGYADVIVTRDGLPHVVNTMHEGTVFGDMGYATSGVRGATVKCRARCRMAVIDTLLYREVVHRERERKVRETVDWLTEHAPICEQLSRRKVVHRERERKVRETV